jgi:hypothetical protein
MTTECSQEPFPFHPLNQREIRGQFDGVVAASAQAESQFQQTGKAARVFTEFVYPTRNSWSRARRVIAKAEHLEKGANPRYVVTSLSAQETTFPAPSRWGAKSLYDMRSCTVVLRPRRHGRQTEGTDDVVR